LEAQGAGGARLDLLSGGRRSPGDRSGGGSRKVKVAFPATGVKSNGVHAIAKQQTVQLNGGAANASSGVQL
jgi:hypothetical protein